MSTLRSSVFNSLAVAVALATTLSGGLVLTGCGGERAPEAAANPASGLMATSAAVGSARADLSKTIGSLLHFKDGADAKATYAEFSASVAGMKSGAAEVKSSYESMQAKKDLYLDAWKKEISAVQDPALKATAAKRISDVQMSFLDITNAFGDAKASYDPFVVSVDSLQKVLVNDQTEAGVKAALPTIETAIAQGTEVSGKLAVISTQLDALSGKLIPAAAAK